MFRYLLDKGNWHIYNSLATTVSCTCVSSSRLMEELDFLRKGNVINMNFYNMLGIKILFPVHSLLKFFLLKVSSGITQAS